MEGALTKSKVKSETRRVTNPRQVLERYFASHEVPPQVLQAWKQLGAELPQKPNARGEGTGRKPRVS